MTITISTGGLVIGGLLLLAALLLGGGRRGCGCATVVNWLVGLICLAVGLILLYASGLLGA
jgi:hypothetical protein